MWQILANWWRRREPPGPDDPRHALGIDGERAAEQFLTKTCGYRILERRYVAPGIGEIDLIARDQRTIVFVEVKALHSDRWTDPELQLRPQQQRRLIRVARGYLRRHAFEDRPCRFDVVGVLIPEDGEVMTRHIPNAFAPKR